MPALSITVESLSKRYRLGELHTDLLSERLTQIFRRRDQDRPELWALRDVNFTLERGSVLGVIGRNGAGKSTLLKILSRITAPTTGRVRIRGRLASLLEVGTGFHPELTGRENIYLNATILGMRRPEIARKFDAIVEFAEVSRFLDTPIKRYSSGMYVRLAFAVAAHLEPDILVIDEVLAVGDRQFQEKCLGRMDEIAHSEGRTVIFVSHNLDAVARICNHGLYLKEGRVVMLGSVRDAIGTYVSSGGNTNLDLAEVKERWGDGKVRITGFRAVGDDGSDATTLEPGKDYDFVISYRAPEAEDISGVTVSLALTDSRGIRSLLVSSTFADEYFTVRGEGSVVCRIRDLALVAGTYAITLYLGDRGGDTHDCLNDVRTIHVAGGDFFGTGHPGYPDQCSTLTRASWRAEP